MPMQQCVGRLHRKHADKQDVCIYDYIEYDHPKLARMCEKRQRGYRVIVCRIGCEAEKLIDMTVCYPMI